MSDEEATLQVVTLSRFAYSDQGTRGTLLLPGGRTLYTLELPWRENKKKKSCIPLGAYKCVWTNSPRFGWCYMVTNVPGRSAILFHNGNFAGDVDKGFKSHSEGCILVGSAHGILNNQRAVTSSVAARGLFERTMNGKPFTLKVVNA